ncbi:MAG: carboxypeptidase regulatory-like domain-containing protein [Acidobacteriota bacterium]
MALLLALALALFGFPAPTPGAGPAASSSAGSISGRVTIVKAGVPLPEAANTIVWIEGLHSPGASGRSSRAEMKSQGKKFVPRVIAVSRTGEVQFPNADPIYHNVFSVSAPNRFDLGLYRSGGSKEKRFEEPGLVRVYCNIHPQMVGFVMVVDSDYAAVTGPDGSFRFGGVPPGNWTVRAWQEEGGEAQAPVTVRARVETPALALTMDASAYKAQPHKNKYGKEYPPAAPSDDERY